jgi:hypothetical protein
MMADRPGDRRWAFRIGGASAVLGALVGLVGNLLHPATSGPADPAATARVVAESQIWIPVHLALVVAFELMLGGLVGIHDSITGGLPVRSRGSDWPRRPLAPRSASCSSRSTVRREASRRRMAGRARGGSGGSPRRIRAVDSINFALISPLNLVFAGITFVLFGLAAALSGVYPRWSGWVVAAAGVAWAVSGVIRRTSENPLGSRKRSDRLAYGHHPVAARDRDPVVPEGPRTQVSRRSWATRERRPDSDSYPRPAPVADASGG